MKLGIYGAGGLGMEFREVAQIINANEQRWEQILFVDDTPELKGTKKAELEIIPFDEMVTMYGTDEIELLLAFGDPAIKDVMYKKVKEKGYRLANMLHPSVYIQYGAQLGEGIVVNPYSTIPTMSVFGNNVLVQGMATMGHDVVLGDNVVISSYVFVGGKTVIGKNTYIAPHACLRDGIRIGENAIIGMGAVVTKDVPDRAVVYGNPARVVRMNEGEKLFK